jgi:hypothetical protein
LSRQFLTPVRLPAGTSNPSGESAGALFFNTEIGTVVVFTGSEWLSLGGTPAIIDGGTVVQSLDGGLYDTVYFSATIDGGIYSASTFSSTTDGGTPGSF